MNIEIYVDLAKHLNKLPGGFPRTDTDVEIEILKRLFNEEEAEIASKLTMIPELPEQISNRTEVKGEKLSEILKKMSKKGLIFRINKKDKLYYMASQFVIGIWEYQVNNLNKDLIIEFNKYIPYLSQQMWSVNRTKQLRIIPVVKEVSPNNNEVLSYNNSEFIIKQQNKILIAPCICRKENNIINIKCNFDIETCFVFGKAADYYYENKLGRKIDSEEAIAILNKGIRQGLVLQTSNSKNPVNLCMCCGCCCQILKNIKYKKNFANLVHSNWYAKINTDKCESCERCINKCQTDSIEIFNNILEINKNKCIGCGNCVLFCESKAIDLFEKNKVYNPPENMIETYIKIYKEKKERIVL